MARREADWQLELDGRHGVWSQEAWCRALGITRPTFRVLDPAPHQVRVGQRLVRVLESPAAYLERARKLRESAGAALGEAA